MDRLNKYRSICISLLTPAYFSTLEIQYPTEPYNPLNSTQCSQPCVGLGEAVRTPIPLAPPQLPPPTAAQRLKWKKLKQQANDPVVQKSLKPRKYLSLGPLLNMYYHL